MHLGKKFFALSFFDILYFGEPDLRLFSLSLSSIQIFKFSCIFSVQETLQTSTKLPEKVEEEFSQ